MGHSKDSHKKRSKDDSSDHRSESKASLAVQDVNTIKAVMEYISSLGFSKSVISLQNESGVIHDHSSKVPVRELVTAFLQDKPSTTHAKSKSKKVNLEDASEISSISQSNKMEVEGETNSVKKATSERSPKNRQKKVAIPSSSSSNSSGDLSDSSDSSESKESQSPNNSQTEQKSTVKSNQETKNSKKKVSDSSSSTSDSDSSSSEVQATAKSTSSREPVAHKSGSKSSETLQSKKQDAKNQKEKGNSNDSVGPKSAQKKSSKKKSSSSTSSSSSESSSDEAQNEAHSSDADSTTSSSSSSSSDAHNTSVRLPPPSAKQDKKRPSADLPNGYDKSPASKASKSAEGSTPNSKRNTPFRYIDESVTYEKDPRLQSNRYEDKVKMFPNEQWGLQAARDLANVSGARFKQEKAKKKRGSYRGGRISMEVNSIQLASDSE